MIDIMNMMTELSYKTLNNIIKLHHVVKLIKKVIL